MTETRYKQKAWLYRRFNNFSLHQLNILSIVFILVFTVLFSLLLIHEEYLQFEKLLDEKKAEHFENQKRIIMADAKLFERLFEYVVSKRGNEGVSELGDMASIAAEDRTKFIIVYDQAMRQLTSGVSVQDHDMLDFNAQQTQTGQALIGDRSEPVLLYRHQLGNGYYILSGIYLSPYEEMLDKELPKMKARLIRIILEIATLSFILFGFILGISKIVNTMLEKDVEVFQRFFEGIADKYQVLNYTTLFFKEFKTMAGHANEMADTIVQQKASLEQLNLTLEDKVKEKTAELRVKNSALEVEKEFSQNLLASQKQFIRYAIHETSTPLSVIVTNIELYTMQHGKDRYLSKVEAAVKNIFNIYDDLSYLVKKDQIEYPKQRIDLCEYLQSRVDFFDEVASFAGVNFKFSCSSERAAIHFNETKLQRIVDNNLTNAIKYTKYGEVITVDIAEEGENY
ncbi:MAG: HAMP domain-containing sensor histidine kinase, partial [Sulfurimonadaceae bacterium]|nr:HAMP domain-containing sensor histidine kinase [Sulfurimonadaceae bacterium]